MIAGGRSASASPGRLLLLDDPAEPAAAGLARIQAFARGAEAATDPCVVVMLGAHGEREILLGDAVRRLALPLAATGIRINAIRAERGASAADIARALDAVLLLCSMTGRCLHLAATPGGESPGAG